MAHHLTPEKLESQAEEFRRHYPDLPGPVFAVMLVETYSPERLADQMVSASGHSPQATIFVCSCRRTPPDTYYRLMSSLETSLEKAGRRDQVKVEGFDFNQGLRENLFNPYVGLLDRADHVIVAGASQSIVSEVLATGKSAFLFENSEAVEDLTDDFHLWPADKPLVTRAIEPPNMTEKVADYVIEQYREKLASTRLHFH